MRAEYSWESDCREPQGCYSKWKCSWSLVESLNNL